MRCTICENAARRAEIDVSIIRGMSYAKVAKRYSKPGEPKVSVGAVGRHARKHLPSQLRDRVVAKALGASSEVTLAQLKSSESESLLQNLLANRARYHSAQDRSRDAGDLANELLAGRLIDSNLKITGALIGSLTQHAQSLTQNIFVTPNWFRIRSAIMTALRPPAYRAAREAIAKALLAIEAAPQEPAVGQIAAPQPVGVIDTTAVEVKDEP